MKKLSDIAPRNKNTLVKTKEKVVVLDKNKRKIPSIKIIDWTKRNTRMIAIATVTSVVLLATLSVILISIANNNTKLEGANIQSPDKQSSQTITKYYSPLTGKEVSEESTTKRPVLAIMIENSTEARPQSGLKEAGVVFEAVAEGGITRFIALYQESEPSLIGPVRSVRPYYLEWSAAFSPAVAHVGGSSEALNMLRSENYGVDLDQSHNSSTYWRTRDRKSPHNVYTNYNNLIASAESKGKIVSNFTGFSRQDSSKTSSKDKESATAINMSVSTGIFAVSYQYDQNSNAYKRFQGGVAHQDREKGQITPDTVIAIRVNQTLKSDRIHNEITTSGSGECFVFQNGIVTKGTWSKSGSSSQIKFADDDGNVIKLNRGQTWITAVPEGKAINWQ